MKGFLPILISIRRAFGRNDWDIHLSRRLARIHCDAPISCLLYLEEAHEKVKRRFEELGTGKFAKLSAR
ncbi:hypothetical protein ACFO4N_11630 [Camelliibacillus cellulosilyticus]|uniref:Uncharacterized protein n=1 Tax=Camelliibacillus cellulosilyticus TaxID=2174486 RepID=A0ABV9GMA3_9BACL